MSGGPWRDAGRRLRAHTGAVIALGIVIVLVLMALVGPWLSPNDLETLDWSHVAAWPGMAHAHWFGTDRLGRDLFVRTLDGARVSLAVGLVASAVSLIVGVSYGAVAGYVGGRTDQLMMRLIEILSGLPLIFFVIFLTVILGRSETLLFVSIGAVGWLTMARIVRGRTLSIRQQEFIEAAVASGASTARIIIKHVVPNVLGPVIVYATLTVPQIILFESFLSFLGLGIQEPRASLGTLIAQGAGRDGGRTLDIAGAGRLSRSFAAEPEYPRRWAARCPGCEGGRMRQPATSMPTLSVEDLQVTYALAGGPASAVRNVSLTVSSHECLGIVGESGSGKTQVFMAVMGLLARNARAGGSVRFEGREILGSAPKALNRIRGSELAMIFQDPMTSLTPHLKIGVQLAEVLVSHRGCSWSDAMRAAGLILERVRVPEPQRRLRQYPHELSGGMRQRVMIGMSLLCEPKLLIADEPTSALDVTVQAQIADLLRALRREAAMAMVLISHDLGVVAGLADRIIVMYAGRVVEDAPASEVLQRARHPYSALLLDCVPNLRSVRLERMPCLPGQALGAGMPERGCAFAPRCPRASDQCRSERPPLRSLHQSVQVACHHPLSP